jgi:hypothetical protein
VQLVGLNDMAVTTHRIPISSPAFCSGMAGLSHSTITRHIKARWLKPTGSVHMSEKQRSGKAKMPVSPGRPKGVPNKTTALLKDAILQAAERAGDKEGLVGYLQTQATANPGPFMALLGKVLPMQIAGPDGAGGKPTAIQIKIVDPKA